MLLLVVTAIVLALGLLIALPVGINLLSEAAISRLESPGRARARIVAVAVGGKFRLARMARSLPP
jgi:predicted TIM-barrel enzyme